MITRMLAAWLLLGLFAAPVATIAMFASLPRPRAVRGWWPRLRRLVAAVVMTVIVTAIAAIVCLAVGTTRHRVAVAAGVLIGFSIVMLAVTRRWNGRAHMCWAACVYLYVSYLAFILDWTLHSGLGAGGTVGGIVLWSLELVAGVFTAAYLWELCATLGTEDWRRRVSNPRAVTAKAEHLPFVSLHVPAHNEPPDMVIDTLQALVRQEYPYFEVVAVDDNTDDPALWQPVASWCAANDVKFVHLSDWPGFKSGALNYALAKMTDPRAEIVGVVDSDYQIERGFLRACAPLFADAQVGFVQAPQDYRGWRQAGYYRRLYYSYKYFFAVSQPSRNEHDAAIFAGTMGLIRRSALQQLGGWDEWCITEDAELSLRLMRAGWSGVHIDETFGRGVMPLTFEALKSQRHRWCFGGIQILRMQWRALLPGHRRADNRLSAGQRWGYLAGGIQWYGDLLGLVFYIFLLAGAINLALGGGQLFRKLTVFLLAAVPVLVLLGLLRAIALLRRGTGASWRDALGAFFVWQATSLVVARASVQGLFAKRATFLRTPKTMEHAGLWRSIRANWAESMFALAGVAGICVGVLHFRTLSGPLLAALLIAPTAGFAAAPFNSVAAQRAALPPDLRRRRRSEFLRGPAVVGTAAAGGGAALAIGVTAIIVALLAPNASHFHTPSLVAPQHSSSRHPHPSSSSSTTTTKTSGAASSSPATSAADSSSSPSPSSSAPSSPPTSSPSASASPTPTPG